MKKKSNKLAKLERNRFSILTDNMDHCALCPSTYELTWHEVFEGTNRKNSMKYGLCIRLCLSCHSINQDNKPLTDKWKRYAQSRFEDEYPNLDFVSIFHRNYKD